MQRVLKSQDTAQEPGWGKGSRLPYQMSRHYKSLEQNHPESRLTFRMEVKGPKMPTCEEIWCMS